MKKVVAALAAAAAFAVADSRAATPPSGSVSSASGTVSWSYGAVVAGTVVDTGVEDICPPGVCDNFDLTVSLPQPAATYYQTNTATLTLVLSWTSTVDSDLDLFAYAPNGAKYGPGSPDTTATGPNSETLTITDPVDGVWHVRSVASLVPLPVSASGSATLTSGPRPSPDIEKQPAGAPLFSNYAAPDNITPAIGSTTASQHGAGEPSIGVNWKTGATFIQAGNHSLRVIWNDATSPAGTTWTDQRSPFSRVSLDPILWTDSSAGRTITSQLDAACSEMSFTDDDGNNWTPTQGCGVPAGPDHQTVGGGNWAAPKPIVTTGYPHAVYYCSQGIADAICARSDDGGLTFGPGVPIYNITQCGGLHGHIRVSPDGTAYVPNHNCQDPSGVARDAIVVTPDNGLTWTVRTVPGSKTSSAGGDPSIAAGANNTLYFGFVNYDGHPKVAVSHDHGATWSKPFDAGTYWDLQNAMFAEVIAGDDDRAAFAFLGTTTPGDDQSAAFNGVWHLYVATTFDGGKSWTTGDVTPTDPVQRGCIWNGGGSNPCRNLLDFNDITTDVIGRVLVGYADGCTGSCVNDPTANASTGPASAQDALATIARQATGKTLFHSFDGTLPK